MIIGDLGRRLEDGGEREDEASEQQMQQIIGLDVGGQSNLAGQMAHEGQIVERAMGDIGKGRDESSDGGRAHAQRGIDRKNAPLEIAAKQSPDAITKRRRADPNQQTQDKSKRVAELREPADIRVEISEKVLLQRRTIPPMDDELDKNPGEPHRSGGANGMADPPDLGVQNGKPWVVGKIGSA